MEVASLPIFRDNYVFVMIGAQTAVCVDPGEAESVLAFLRSRQLNLAAIWITHHHPDHIGGTSRLKQHYPQAVVYGNAADRDRLPKLDVALVDNECFEWAGLAVTVMDVPGHTLGHIAYYLSGHLFSGDTLFAGGCGRLKEGTPAQMLTSLERLRQLPDDTLVWCAHEYTETNLRFALTVEPDNEALQQRYQSVVSMRAANQATIPSTIAIEKQTNPFLRWQSPTIQQSVGSTDPVRVISRLRGRKDLF